MKTNPKAKRTYVVSKCGSLKLSYNPKSSLWTFTGGQFGDHHIYAPNVYNARVGEHWKGYIVNNNLNPQNSTYNNYSK